MEKEASLKDLSLKAIGDYFFSLCQRLQPIITDNLNQDYQEYVEIFGRLNNILIESIPCTLANDVTNKMLNILDNWLKENNNFKNNNNRQDVCRMLASSVIHTQVTRIEPGKYDQNCVKLFSDHKYKSTLLAQIIAQMITLSPRLKVFNWVDKPIVLDWETVNFPPQLEELSGFLDDIKLLEVANSCKNLRSLSVSNIKAVTDESVNVILGMNTLEKLNILGCGITKEGVTHLLNGLIEKDKSLKLRYLKMTCSQEHLPLCNQLPSIIFSIMSKSNEPDLDTHLLSNNKIHGMELSVAAENLVDVLQNIADTLVVLDLTLVCNEGNIYNIYNSIGQMCKHLRCLHINMGFFTQVEGNWIFPALSGFQTVTCLKLDEYSEQNDISSVRNSFRYFLNQCCNVKDVEINFDPCKFHKREIMESAQEGEIKKLENLNFKLSVCENCALLNPEGFNIEDEAILDTLLENCQNLRSVSF